MMWILKFVSVTFVTTVVYGCCIPPWLSGQISITAGLNDNGKGSGMQGIYNFSYDGQRNINYMKGIIYYNGYPIEQTLIQDYRNKSQYVIMGRECSHGPEPLLLNLDSTSSCLAIDQKLYQTYLGSGKNKLKVDVYSIGNQEKSSNSIKQKYQPPIILTVASNTCVPVSQRFFVEDGVFSIVFSGVNTWIEDTSVFDIPASCNSAHGRKRMTHSLALTAPLFPGI